MAPPAPMEIDIEGVTDVSSVVIPDPVLDGLKVEDVHNTRATGTQMPGGVAAHASSDMFKSAACFKKPKAKRWDHRINLESKSRKGSSLKSAAQYLKIPGMISLGGGLPSSDYFPVENISFKHPTPPDFSEAQTRETGRVAQMGKYDVAQGKDVYDLSIALNYGQATGSAQLLRFVTEHTEIVHQPSYSDWQCCLTAGSTSALDMAYRMFCTRGEYILSEEYTFATAVETAAPLGIRVAGVEMDAQGLLPTNLDHILDTWDESARGGPKPWLLYTVPSGQNPTGATQGLERRKDIYKIAQKHDLYILEDEPYYFLQMQPYTGPDVPETPLPKSHADFIKALIPSYLSMDVDGRVLRLDSFSKVIAPGSRVGWVVGSEQIIERFIRHHEVSTQNPSGISQAVLFKLLDESWGHGGYLGWLLYIRAEYTKRRDRICHACEIFLPREVASWNPPAAGMFHWVKIKWQLHPLYNNDPSHDNLLKVEDSIFHAAIDRGVLLSKGSWFRSESGTDSDIYFRATFAAAPADKVAEAISRFGDALKREFRIRRNGVRLPTEANGAQNH